jgi:hypothetical protein
MKRVITLISCIFILASLMLSVAQEVEEPTVYEPFGGAGFEVGEYEPIEGYEAGVNDEEVGGSLLVRIAEPTEQAIDVVLVGPNGVY